MKAPRLQRRTLVLIAVVLPLLALFGYVALRSGPLAPVAVTVATVQSRALTPALFGVGTAQARYVHKIGPTLAGRVLRLDAQVGDQVRAGQVLGEMDPVDLDDRLRAQQAAVLSAEAALRQADARLAIAELQARRYERQHTASAIIAVLVSGMRIRKKVWKTLQPSSFAASLRSLGRPR